MGKLVGLWRCVKWWHQLMWGALRISAMTNSFRSQSRFCNFFEFYPFTLTKAASDSTNKLSIELIISNNALVFKAATVVFFFFCIGSIIFWRTILFATCAGSYFLSCLLKWYSNAADLQWMLSLSEVLGQTKNLCCFQQGDIFFSLKEWCSYFLLWASFFFLFTLGLFLLLIFPWMQCECTALLHINFVKCADLFFCQQF